MGYCKKCRGTGRIKCPKCQGSGRVGKEKCHKCYYGGTMWIAGLDSGSKGRIECDRCDGTGKYDSSQYS